MCHGGMHAVETADRRRRCRMVGPACGGIRHPRGARDRRPGRHEAPARGARPLRRRGEAGDGETARGRLHQGAGVLLRPGSAATGRRPHRRGARHRPCDRRLALHPRGLCRVCGHHPDQRDAVRIERSAAFDRRDRRGSAGPRNGSGALPPWRPCRGVRSRRRTRRSPRPPRFGGAA